MSEQTLTAPVPTANPSPVPARRSSSVPLEMVNRNKLASVFADSAVLARRSLMRIPRQPDWLVGAIVQPIMFLLLFRYIFAGTIQQSLPQGTSAVDFLVAGIVVQGLVFGSFGTALGLATDAKEGLMDRFRSLPMTRSSVLLGRILADMVLSVVVTTITILFGILVGFRPTGDIVNWLAAAGLMMLMSFTFCWIGAFIGLSLKSIEAVNSVGLIWVFPLTFISSAFVQPDYMPTWLQGFAKNQPFTLTVDSVRGWLTGYPDVGNKGWFAAAWLVGILIIAIPLSVWSYERRSRT